MFVCRKVAEIILMLVGTVPGAIGTYLLERVSLGLLIRRAVVLLMIVVIVVW